MKFHDHITDSELLEQFASSGSQAAFAKLVQRHGAMVRAVAMRVLANHHDAEDVTQAVFIKLAKEAGKLMGQASVAGWLHTVSRHLSLNTHKSRESRQKREHAVMDLTTITVPANEEIAIAFRCELDTALAHLPERYRQPLVLFHLEGAPLHKCAELLELNPVTLRTRLSRARDMLRSALVRRGVEVASVAGLASLLTAEAKASALSPVLIASILDTASGASATVSPAVLELANTTVKFKSAGISTLILTPLIIMKTKTTATAIAALIIAALCTTAYILKEPNSPDSANLKTDSNSHLTNQTRETKTSTRTDQDPLSKMSREEFFTLFNSIAMIPDKAEQLAAIREKLGMNISDEAYHKALAAYGYNPSLHGRGEFMECVFNSWLKEDPSAVIKWGKRFSGAMRSGILNEIQETWMETDPTAAMAWAEENLEAQQLAAERKKMEKIEQANDDKFIIADIAEQIKTIEEPNGKNRDQYNELKNRINRALPALAKDDPKAALDVFQSLDQKMRSEMSWMEGTLYREFALKDPATATASLMALKPEQRRHMPNTMLDLYSIWASKDPDAAIASAMSFNAGEDRSKALLAALPAWQVKYPEKNIEQAADLSVLNEIQYNTLIGQLVERMAITDPAAAAEYAMGMNDAEMKSQFVSITADAWARKDTVEALRWINSLPEGDLRDTGLISVAKWVANTDLAHTDQLINQIGDPELRHSIIENALESQSNIGREFSAALKLADQLPYIDESILDIMTRRVSPKDADHLEIWLRDTNAQGRIIYHSPQPSEGFQKMLNNLKVVKAIQQQKELMMQKPSSGGGNSETND